MTCTPSIRSFERHEWQTYRDLRLRALADSPDAFGSTLADERTRSDAEWAGRLQSGIENPWNLPVLAEVAPDPIGMAWGRIEESNPDVATVYQMWVAPTHRRLGAGELLLQAVIAWAKAQKVHRVILGVTCGDTSAYRLYARAGFAPVGEPAPLRPGSRLLSQPMRLELADDAA